ncbi:MAG: 50S ribosomal protein L11 methyltransferase, partial [Caldilineaceae bacterium]|nr:50S ribosomal protein L11 methyltransferase [Caldilineaceae bacterium]
THMSDLIEISVVVDTEAAEAVSELFNRFNGGGYEEENEAGEAGGGGAVIEVTGVDDFGKPIQGKYRVVVKTYLKPGKRGEATRQQIEEGLWRLSLLYPIPEPQIRIVQEEDWSTAWKKFYKPLRIGRRVVLKPTWEEFQADPDDIVIHLDPGMAFGTGLHPTTRLCVAALETLVQPGATVLDVGTGSGVLSLVAHKLGAGPMVATDIDPLAVQVTLENAARNNVPVIEATTPHLDPDGAIVVSQASVPADLDGVFDIVVANILAEVLAKLFDGAYDNVPLAAPLRPDGHIILSGIIQERVDIVTAAVARHGLTLLETLQEGDWIALIARK